MNCGCARLPIALASRMEIGIVTSAIDREQRGDPEHHRQDADDHQDRGDQLAQRLLQGLRDVVDVVRHPREQLAARLVVEVTQRQAVQLALGLPAQAEDEALDDPAGEPALDEAERERDQVHGEDEQQRPPDGVEVDALTWRHIHGLDEVRELVPPVLAQFLHRLRLVGPAGQVAADHAGEHAVGGLPEQARPHDGRGDAEDPADQHDDQEEPLRAHHPQQPQGGALEVHRLLGRHRRSQRGGLRAEAAGAGRCRSAGGCGGLAHSCFPERPPASAAVSWDSTISR